MKPYKNLSSNNLSLLLLVVRITTAMSLLTVILALIGISSQLWLPGFGASTWNAIGLAMLLPSLKVLLGSGVIAAIIAFKEYRKKSAAYIASLTL